MGKIIKNFLYRLLTCITLCIFALNAREYPNFDKKTKKHKTQKQKELLFKNVGCTYSNAMVIDPAVHMCLACDSQYFKDNQDAIVAWGKKYTQDILNKNLAGMYLKFVSPTIGYGIFAISPIKEGDFIGVYAGKLRNLNWTDPRFKEDVDYAWYYTIPNKEGDNMIIDGKYEGNELRFINHSENPNTKRIDVIAGDIFYLCYVACKDIAKDEELTVSYGKGYWDSRGITPEKLL